MSSAADHNRLRKVGWALVVAGVTTTAVAITAGLTSGHLIMAGLTLLVLGGLLFFPFARMLILELFPPEPPERPGRVILISVWIGLLAGLAELTVLAIQYHLGHRWGSLASFDGAVTPLSYVGLVLLPAAAVAFWARRGSPRLGSYRCAVFAATWVAGVSLALLYYPELHLLVVPILATGIAVRAGSLANRHKNGLSQLARMTTGPLLLGFAILGVAPSLVGRLTESRAQAALVPAEDGLPNVLLIVWDTVRAANLSLYGYNRETTPNLERLAFEGVVFERAVSPASWTLPSHASLFTGLDPYELDVDWDRPLGSDHRTLAEVLQKKGYVTAGFTANWMYTGPHSGLGRGFHHYDAEGFSVWTLVLGTRLIRWATSLILPKPPTPPASASPDFNARYSLRYNIHPSMGLKTASTVTDEFLAWLMDAGPRPFFGFLNYFEAHLPYYPQAPFDGRFDSSDAPLPPIHPEKGIALDGWRGIALYSQYDGGIASIDHELGRLLDVLDAQGRLQNTLVIVTSDHGEEFGEHGVFWHGRSLYLPTIHVPLVMALPGKVPAGRRISTPVTLRDVSATVLDVLRLRDQEALPGRSLALQWKAAGGQGSPRGQAIYSGLQKGHEGLPPEWAPASRGDMVSLVADGFHYIRNGDGIVELYDIERDPWEFQDLAGLPDAQSRLRSFEASLERMGLN